MDGTISQLADQVINQAPLYALDGTNTTSNAPPPKAGVYGWWFRQGALPTVPVAGCVKRGNWCLLYIGIAPKTTEQRYDAALPNSSLLLLRQRPQIQFSVPLWACCSKNN